MKWKINSNTGKNKLSVEKIISILLSNRGITGKKEIDQFLTPSITSLEKNFFDSKQLQKAIARIKRALKHNEQVIVYSDYDVDGITGTAILWETLHDLNVNAMPFVPHRFKHGYGLSKKGIDDLLAQYPDTKIIITVDSGITAAEEVEYLKKKNIDVIITDHHSIPDPAPEPLAIIHTTELSGSGVAYIFSRVIKSHPEFISGSIPNNRQILKQVQNDTANDHLALAAIGTISDLVPLTGSNRVIVMYGLAALAKTKRVGLIALMDACGILDHKTDTYHVGFMIGPRINAAGRLDHGLYALQLLCTKSEKRARELAAKLTELNVKRQEMMGDISEHAKAQVIEGDTLLFISHESYHEGVIGLVAGNLVEAFYRPAIVVSIGKEISKGSARSIRGLNIIETIRTSSRILINVGGHPMAAGFSVKTELLDTLKKELTAVFNEQLKDELFEKEMGIDMELPFSEITDDLQKNIIRMKPFGVGNPEPVFVTRGVSVTSARIIGRDGRHMKLTVMSGNKTVDAIGFTMSNRYEELSKDARVDIAYCITENEWQGKKSLQLKLRDIHVVH